MHITRVKDENLNGMAGHVTQMPNLTRQYICLPTCVVWIIVRSFMQDMPGPMAALSPAVPNSIREEKHFFSASTFP